MGGGRASDWFVGWSGGANPNRGALWARAQGGLVGYTGQPELVGCWVGSGRATSQ